MAVNAWNTRLGTEQGRIAPVNFTPTQGSFVFCLGNDLPGRLVRMKVGDFVENEQTADFGGSTLLRFNARTRGSLQLPRSVLVTTAAASTYTVTINGTVFTYVAGAGDSKAARSRSACRTPHWWQRSAPLTS